jgi:hypothetical protein
MNQISLPNHGVLRHMQKWHVVPALKLLLSTSWVLLKALA